eukprot:TRINITY_DN4931_c0_g1_i4.p1 TRINITY_DN4931_c0_g1~~TRINITY_DN4931_c0_g1_i4.p1  ORF type:complete len:1496 (-),score=337.73 TRINITY_DN4931_c0_g1_i4:226-4713(-)
MDSGWRAMTLLLVMLTVAVLSAATALPPTPAGNLHSTSVGEEPLHMAVHDHAPLLAKIRACDGTECSSEHIRALQWLHDEAPHSEVSRSLQRPTHSDMSLEPEAEGGNIAALALNVSSVGGEEWSERNALCALYHATSGDEWFRNQNWCTDDPHTYEPCPDGEWFGVTCSLDRVAELNLPDNLLNGTLPSGFRNLANMTKLNLFANDIYGDIPDSFCSFTALEKVMLGVNKITSFLPDDCWSSLANLQELHMPSNEISTPIPLAFGNAKALVEVDLAYNRIYGELDDPIQSLDSLVALNMSHNSLQVIGPGITKAPNLKRIVIRGNRVYGELPEWIADSSLEDLSFSHNFFFGSMPDAWRTFSSLKYLDLSFNQLTGSFPDWLPELPDIRKWWLQGNDLTGTLPANIGNATSLESLSFAQNHLVGDIPRSIKDLHNLKGLYGFANKLTSIPDVFHKEMQLEQLAMYFNEMEGPFPNTIAKLPNLVVLYIYRNKLSGTITKLSAPNLRSLVVANNNLHGRLEDIAEFDNMPILEEVNINANNFTGSMPKGMFQDHLRAFLAEENSLTGSIPEEVCNAERLGNIALDSNRIEGSIPVCMVLLEKLRRFSVPNNRLSGPLTIESGYPSLEYLAVNENDLSGPLPNAYLPALKELHLSGNKFIGSISPSISLFTNLRVFRANENMINGTIPEDMGLLPQLSELSLRGNQLTGTIPRTFGLPFVPKQASCAFEFVDTALHINADRYCIWFEERPLSVLDVSVNDLEGSVPEEFFRMESLYFLNIKGNPRMRSLTSPPFPENPLIAHTQPGNFSCRELLSPGASFTFDHAYYNYTLCRCNEGYYGSPPHLCLDCPLHADCPGGTSLSVHHGLWPVCEPEECGASSLLVGLEECAEEEQCIPDGGCKYDFHLGLDEHCELCEEGYHGRVCSHCAHGYYHRGEECFKCGSFTLYWYLPLFIGGWLITTIAAASDYHITHSLGEAAVVTLLWMVNAVPVWLMYFIFLIFISQVLNTVGTYILQVIKRYRTRKNSSDGHGGGHAHGHDAHGFALSPGAIESLLFFLQSREAFALALEVEEGEFDPFKLNRFQIGGLECYSDFFDVYGRFLTIMLLPVAILLTVVVVYVLGLVAIFGMAWYKRRKRRQKAKDTSEMEGLVAAYSAPGEEEYEDDDMYSPYSDPSSVSDEEDEYVDDVLPMEFQDDAELRLAEEEERANTEDVAQRQRCSKITRRVRRWSNRCLRSLLLITTILYFEVSKNIFEMFACEPDPFEEGVYWMEHAPYVQCYTYNIVDYDNPMWAWIFYTSLVCVVVYTIGIPLLWVVLIVTARLRGKLHEKATLSRIGYLYEDYRGGFWLWQVVTTTRLLLLVAFAAALINTNPWQPALMATVLILALASHTMFKPYKLCFDNWILTWTLLSVSIQFIFTLLNATDSEQYDDSDGFGIVITVLDSVTMFLLLASFTRPLFRVGMRVFGAVKRHVHKRRSRGSIGKERDRIRSQGLVEAE